VRLSDLQEAPLTKDRRLVNCDIDRDESAPPSAGFVLWSIPGEGGYIWDASSSAPTLLKGMDSSDVRECKVSFDRANLVLVRKSGSAELWSLKGNKLSDFQAGGVVRSVQWTLQGTSVTIARDTGEIMLFDVKGVPIAKLSAPGSGRGTTSRATDVSFDPMCGNIFVWTPDGRVLQYTKKLKIFDLPYPIPFFWHRLGRGCNN
jgi:WD40 repeat protein